MGRIYENPRREASSREPAGLASSPEVSETTASESAEESLEVFTLRPLSHRRVTARVRRKGPARFRFVIDGD